MSCLFCKIAAGEIPSEMVAENAGAFAFLDIRPLRPGHVLVVPKAHAARLEEMDPASAAAVAALAQVVLRRQEKALGAQGATVGLNNGEAAGQEVPHVHLHVVPREQGDGIGPIHALFGGPKDMPRERLQEIGAKLRG